ncbi:DEK1 [Symbiodinium necroappetens]|uniref:DEK1 protein n=1 Tax=Symbiodinium necroappetens TaxID=1628268 RepID=A0A812P566_9DINO|nr:DEK1 [Symbiodinium necroappetens]
MVRASFLAGAPLLRFKIKEKTRYKPLAAGVYYETLHEAHEAGWVLSTTFTKSRAAGGKAGQGKCGEGITNDGLVHGHVYSVLRVVEAFGNRLVCCRNPWGQGEWKGKWSDANSFGEWTPEMKEATNYRGGDDGTFWMSIEDNVILARCEPRDAVTGYFQPSPKSLVATDSLRQPTTPEQNNQFADLRLAAMAGDEQRSKPGWSLARDKPRPKKKQGWECPAPSVEDWEDYKLWLEQQERKEELPAAPQIFLADFSLLFHQDPDVKLPWIHRVKCELPRRVGRLAGDLPVRASYIGFATDSATEGFELFKEAMGEIGIVLCRHIHHPPNRFELAHLEQSDLILVDGGDRRRLWDTLSTDLGASEVAEHVKWRYLQGAVVLAIGEAMSLLGQKSWYCSGTQQTIIPFKGWGIFPHIVAPETEETDLEDLVEQLGGAGVVILGIHKGAGMIFNKDGLVEPARHMIQEYRWDWQSSSVKQALLLGPPRNTGLLCPLYAASRDLGDATELEDVYSYALTQEEEEDEDHLMSQFDPSDSWLDMDSRNEVESLKKQGNEAFKAGKADLSGLFYSKAQVLLRSSAKPWRNLDEEWRKQLEEIRKAKRADPSSDKKVGASTELASLENYQATNLQLSILLNLCASSLLAYSQDVARKEEKHSNEEFEGPERPVARASAEQMLVEVKDNLVIAFRAANEALRLSQGRSAKAWFRRAAAFEQMRDPRNALLDLEEALLREPGDRAISRKRNEMHELASKVAENMFYARHKELDAQEQRLQLGQRRALHLRGYLNTDSYNDEAKEFAVAQPVAREVHSTLEEVDGRPQLRLPTPPEAAKDAPYLLNHALWTWEFLVQRSPGLRILRIEDVDLGSGPLEWLCKGLRGHKEIQALQLTGVHLGPAGSKMLRNVLAQNTSLIDMQLDRCGLLDSGLAELSAGLKDHSGQLEFLSLRQNMWLWLKKCECEDDVLTVRACDMAEVHLQKAGHLGLLRDRCSFAVSVVGTGKLADVFCGDCSLGLGELDLSGNAFGVAGAKELAKILGPLAAEECVMGDIRDECDLQHAEPCTGSGSHQLRVLRLQDGWSKSWQIHVKQALSVRSGIETLLRNAPLFSRKDCLLDLVANLDNGRPLAQLDLRVNPIGRGTRRCWRSTMAPNLRCEATTILNMIKLVHCFERSSSSFANSAVGCRSCSRILD